MNKNKKETLAMNLEPNPAQEARDLLFYAAEEGTEHDVKVFYEGLDMDKRVAFIENEKDLSHLPDSIVNVLLDDKNPEVRNALKKRKDFFIHTAVAGAPEKWENIYGLTHEQIVENGRSCVARILSSLLHSDRPFRDDELEAISIMARNIPDPRVIESLMPFAERSYKIARDLIDNPAISAGYLKKLLDIGLEKGKGDSVWHTLPIEIILYHPDKIDEQTINEVRNTPELRHLFEILEPPEKPIQSEADDRKHKIRNRKRIQSLARKEKRLKPRHPSSTLLDEDEPEEA